MKFLPDGKQYFEATYPERLLWEAEGWIVQTVLVNNAWVDIAVPKDSKNDGK